MSRIEFRCAPQWYCNPGMASVDYAAYVICRDAGILDRVSFRRPWPTYGPDANGSLPWQASRDRSPVVFNYGFADGHNLKSGDQLFYWGDFQHGRDYLSKSCIRARSLSKEAMAFSDAELKDAVYQHFMCEKFLDAGNGGRAKIYLFGGTLFQNSQDDLNDERYLIALRNLLKESELRAFRDAPSTLMAENVLRINGTGTLGTDAALLNTSEELLELSLEEEMGHASGYTGACGVFFGRSSSVFPFRRLSLFLRTLCKSLGVPLAWIPWDAFSGGKLFYSRLHRIDGRVAMSKPLENNTQYCVGDLHAAIKQCSCIVTDTYHLALNAIVHGIPVLCVWEPSPASEFDCNIGSRTSPRDKRALFFNLEGLTSLLVPTSDFDSRRNTQGRAEELARVVSNEGLIGQLYAPVLSRARVWREKIACIVKSAA